MKTIATDCDGVLLDWWAGFDPWMSLKHGMHMKNPDETLWTNERYGVSREEITKYITQFNGSVEISRLPTYKDSLLGVEELVRRGYNFVVITALGNDSMSHILREMNLKQQFGDVFSEVHCLGIGDSKKETLSRVNDQYDVVAWLEDTPSHASTGVELGVNSYLFDAPYNRSDSPEGVTRVPDWAGLIKQLDK